MKATITYRESSSSLDKRPKNKGQAVRLFHKSADYYEYVSGAPEPKAAQDTVSEYDFEDDAEITIVDAEGREMATFRY